MQVNRFGKLGSLSVVSWPLVVGALVLASCGSDTASSASVSTISLDATNYIVKDPVTTTTEPLSADPGDGIVAGSQTYVVQSGDYPLKVANDFGVPVEDLLNFNGWATASEFPFPGEEIKIPPGGTTPGAAAPAADAAVDPATDAGGATEAVGETIPEAGSNCEPGSYTIAAGDFENKVASKFDVTLDALRSANSGTSGYSAFYPGLKIVIPAKSNC